MTETTDKSFAISTGCSEAPFTVVRERLYDEDYDELMAFGRQVEKDNAAKDAFFQKHPRIRS